MLSDLFNWHLTSETSGWAPINILHRISTEGNVVRSGRPGSKILCREMTTDQLRTQKAYNSLSLPLKIIVCAKYMPVPLKEDGTPQYKKWGDREKADYLTETVRVFNYQYNRAINFMAKKM